MDAVAGLPWTENSMRSVLADIRNCVSKVKMNAACECRCIDYAGNYTFVP